MDHYGLPGAYVVPPCAGCGPGTMPVSPAAPPQGEMDSYSYVNPVQKQLPQTANQMASGMHQPMGSALAPMISPTPTLQDVANYNYMSPAQRREQQQQLAQAGSQMFVGMPGWQAARNQGPLSVPGQQQVTDGSLAPITPTTQPAPISGDSLQYLNGFLRTQIGRPVKVDFLIGTNTLLDKAGILIGVGANYILLNESETDDIVACDFYNIKFVKFYY